MDSGERGVKSQLIETIANIRQKYKLLDKKSNELSEALNIQYKPLLDPLNKLVANSAKSESTDNHRNNSFQNEKKIIRVSKNTNPKVSLNRISLIKLDDFLEVIDKPKHDPIYGIRSKNDSYYIGETQVLLDANEIIVCGESFPLTLGLMNLLFLRVPRHYRDSDLNHYKRIIELTNLHKRFNQPNAKIRSHKKSYKFNTVIEPLFTKVGESLQTDLIELRKNAKVDYKYWNNPNELVDRLRLLIASQSAGHTGHNNEVIAIIEELREENIIE